jgi:hypothetical protein
MPEYGKVTGYREVPRLNRATGEVENYYRYTVITPKGNIFTETVTEAVARSTELDAVLAAKAKELDKLVSK